MLLRETGMELLWPTPPTMFAEQRHSLAGLSLQGVILLQGGEQQNQDNTSNGLPFRQESFFYYLTGASDPADPKEYSDNYMCGTI